MSYKKLFKEFFLWIENIEEDTPLPYECNVICFGLTRNNMIFYSASECVPKIIIPCEFYPLDAQCFNHTKNIDFKTFECLVKDFFKIKKHIFNANIFCYGKEFMKPIIIS